MNSLPSPGCGTQRPASIAIPHKEIRKAERQAEAIKVYWKHLAEVREHAERVILIARIRVGEEEAKVANHRGRPTKNGRTAPNFSTADERHSSRRVGLRLKQLFEVGKSKVLEIAATLQAKGKEATQTGVAHRPDGNRRCGSPCYHSGLFMGNMGVEPGRLQQRRPPPAVTRSPRPLPNAARSRLEPAKAKGYPPGRRGIVRFLGNCGREMLNLSLSVDDPMRASGPESGCVTRSIQPSQSWYRLPSA
jgi:hypothetical protein